jgi:hypothetical protein
LKIADDQLKLYRERIGPGEKPAVVSSRADWDLSLQTGFDPIFHPRRRR